MFCPGSISFCLSKLADAIEFRCLTPAAHVVPFIVGHLGLDDELRAEVYSADWQLARKLAFLFLSLQGASLMWVLDIASEGIISCGHPCR